MFNDEYTDTQQPHRLLYTLLPPVNSLGTIYSWSGSLLPAALQTDIPDTLPAPPASGCIQEVQFHLVPESPKQQQLQSSEEARRQENPVNSA